jgi:hypothetical protein
VFRHSQLALFARSTRLRHKENKEGKIQFFSSLQLSTPITNHRISYLPAATYRWLCRINAVSYWGSFNTRSAIDANLLTIHKFCITFKWTGPLSLLVYTERLISSISRENSWCTKEESCWYTHRGKTTTLTVVSVKVMMHWDNYFFWQLASQGTLNDLRDGVMTFASFFLLWRRLLLNSTNKVK